MHQKYGGHAVLTKSQTVQMYTAADSSHTDVLTKTNHFYKYYFGEIGKSYRH